MTCSGRAHRAAREGEVSGHARARDLDTSQFIAKDFKEFIALAELTHVRTAPYYPQSNGKQERWYQSFKAEAWRPGVPVTYEDGLRGRRLCRLLQYRPPAQRDRLRHAAHAPQASSKSFSMLAIRSSQPRASATQTSAVPRSIRSTRSDYFTQPDTPFR